MTEQVGRLSLGEVALAACLDVMEAAAGNKGMDKRCRVNFHASWLSAVDVVLGRAL